MAWLFFHGEGVEKNLKKAYTLFEESAYLGSIESFSPLAIMNNEGIGKDKDIEKAFMWSSMASELYDPDAMEISNELSKVIDKENQDKILDEAARLLAEIISKRN